MPENTDDTRLITILLIVIGAIIILPMGFGMMGFGSMMGGMWGGGMWGDGAVSGWMFIVGIVMQLLFLVALVGESISSTEPLQGVRATSTRQWRNSGSRMLVATSLTRSTNSGKPRSNETPEASPRTMAPTGETTPHPLPLWIEQYTTAGLYGLVLGTVLCFVARSSRIPSRTRRFHGRRSRRRSVFRSSNPASNTGQSPTRSGSGSGSSAFRPCSSQATNGSATHPEM